MPFLHLHMMQFETVYSLISFNSSSFTQRIPFRDPSELYGYLLREQVGRGRDEEVPPQPQSSHCSLGAVALLVSVDSLRALLPSANDPLGHRFLRSPVLYRTSLRVFVSLRKIKTSLSATSIVAENLAGALRLPARFG